MMDERFYRLTLAGMVAIGLAVLSLVSMGSYTNALSASVGFVMTGWVASNQRWLQVAAEAYVRPGSYPWIGVD